MRTRPATRKRPRPGLSEQRVVTAAITLADEGGVDALTMRRLAHMLGVEAMSLYHYTANKSALLDLMVDSVVAEFALPSPDVDWKAALRRSALSAHAVLRRHRWASAVMEASSWRTARLRWNEGLLAALRRAGLTPEQADHAYHVLESHIVGFTLWQTTIAFQPKTRTSLVDVATAFMKTLDPVSYPNVIAHVRQHLTEKASGKTSFEFGLDLILDGLERLSA